MKEEQKFYNRLKYAPFQFKHCNNAVPAYRHTNPDGSIGGWVAETALVEPTVYIAPDAQVFEYASVKGNAKILHESYVCEFATVQDSAVVDDYSMVCGNSFIHDDAYVGGQSIIAGDTNIGGYQEVESEIIDVTRT